MQSVNINPPRARNQATTRTRASTTQIRTQMPVLITGICVLICVVLALVLVVAWLRARGGFMFTDCIAKNRGAVVAPWREFRTEGNSYFLFTLLVGFVLLIVAALLS